MAASRYVPVLVEGRPEDASHDGLQCPALLKHADHRLNNMQYVSTRQGRLSPLAVSDVEGVVASSPDKLPAFCDILLGGMAPDGGLYLPLSYPQITARELQSWRLLDYPGLAGEILSRFASDIPKTDLHAITSNSYRPDAFCYARRSDSCSQITPLTRLQDYFYLLELSNGPTLAFKDMAMQLLGNLFEYVLARRNKQLVILGATSGDTGSAAEYAMRGRSNIQVFMLSPHGRMSPFQRAQMYSLTESNIYNIAIEGDFDQAQDIVKAIMADSCFKEQYSIGAVNSINWARVAAQVIYYFNAWLMLSGENEQLQEVDFAVPSGNFGNICAGHIARQMGLPIGQLVLATNENDVLDEFFKTAVYRPRLPGQTQVTSSPSMDISRASNFERFIYDLSGRDATVVQDLWDRLAKDGYFDLGEPRYRCCLQRLPDFAFKSGKSTHQDRVATIRKVWRQYGQLIDTHTADGVFVASQYRRANVPMVVLETAQAVKFEDSIVEAVGEKPHRPSELVGIEELPQRVNVLPPEAEKIKAAIRYQLQ